MSIAGLTAASSGLTGTSLITYDGHGLETNDPVTVRPVAVGGALPEPLVEGTTYYVRRLTNEAFELAEEVDGDAIIFFTDAVSMVVARDPDFDLWIEFYSRWIDISLPAHIVPLGVTEAVHPLIRGLCADLVAERMFNVSGQPSTEAMKAIEVATAAQLARFSAGVPLRGAPVSTSANRAVTLSTGTPDARGWGLRFP